MEKASGSRLQISSHVRGYEWAAFGKIVSPTAIFWFKSNGWEMPEWGANWVLDVS